MALLKVESEYRTTAEAPTCISSTLTSAPLNKISKTGFARTVNPTAQGIATIIENLIALPIVFCTPFLSFSELNFESTGIIEDESAFDMATGTFISIIYSLV